MPYNKSFIDQASSVKMAGYWPSSLFAIYGQRRSRLVNNIYFLGKKGDTSLHLVTPVQRTKNSDSRPLLMSWVRLCRREESCGFDPEEV